MSNVEADRTGEVPNVISRVTAVIAKNDHA
jgi:hypothetical protein